jgi:hypothetical protein
MKLTDGKEKPYSVAVRTVYRNVLILQNTLLDKLGGMGYTWNETPC